jgi:hypothetical protein
VKNLAKELGFHIAWGACVPSEDLGAKQQVISKVTGGRIPKVQFPVTSPAQIPAAKAAGFSWCLGINGLINSGTPGSMLTDAISTVLTCKAEHRRTSMGICPSRQVYASSKAKTRIVV